MLLHRFGKTKTLSKDLSQAVSGVLHLRFSKRKLYEYKGRSMVSFVKLLKSLFNNYYQL